VYSQLCTMHFASTRSSSSYVLLIRLTTGLPHCMYIALYLVRLATIPTHRLHFRYSPVTVGQTKETAKCKGKSSRQVRLGIRSLFKILKFIIPKPLQLSRLEQKAMQASRLKQKPLPTRIADLPYSHPSKRPASPQTRHPSSTQSTSSQHGLPSPGHGP
jgi:hypothetical protein